MTALPAEVAIVWHVFPLTRPIRLLDVTTGEWVREPLHTDGKTQPVYTFTGYHQAEAWLRRRGYQRHVNGQPQEVQS